MKKKHYSFPNEKKTATPEGIKELRGVCFFQLVVEIWEAAILVKHKYFSNNFYIF